MRSYIIRGHGEIIPETFKLKNGQYVVFAQQCGDPALFGTTLGSHMKRLLKSPGELSRYIRGNYNKSKFPPAFRNPIILGPGNNVRNMVIQMKNYRERVHKHMGVFNAQKNNNNNKRWYTTANRWYLRGRGRAMKLSSQSAIGNRKGIFYVNSCRTGPNYENKNNVHSERIYVGKPSGIPRTASNIRTHTYETYRTQKFKAKRKRTQQNMTLAKKSPSPRPMKKRRLRLYQA